MPTWSKEDKVNYDKSEVFQELEKLTIANIHRLDLLTKKAINGISPNAIEATRKSIQGLKKDLQDLTPALNQAGLTGSAEDQLSEIEMDDPSMLSGTSEELAKSMMNESMDANVSDAIVNELMEMKEAAIKEGNIRLAYKIERTLDEILSVETI